MSNIQVRIRNPETIRARLRPQQGIKVGNSNKYLFDPDLVVEYVEDARDWAIKTDGLVDEEDYSSKAWAIGGTGTETNNSKYWAEQSATSASNAATSETNAGLSATSASNSASTATTQAGIATTQAGIATTKASEASNSASTATTQAGIATTKAGEASTSATNASNSESNALTYSNNASNSATSAGNSATTATTQAGIATTQAGLSKQWAVGEPTEPVEGSAKYWAEQASHSVAYDGQLDIQVNGSSIATFTANQSGNTTANVVVPDSATWGNITGTLSNQTDLQTALNGKYDASNPNGYITGINSSDVTTALGYTPVNPTSLANVATSGSYNDLSNKPSIPTATSELTNDSGFITSSALTPYALSSSLSAVATSGDYSDLINTPTVDQIYDSISPNAQSGVAVAQAVATKQDSATALTTTNTYYSGTTLYIG